MTVFNKAVRDRIPEIIEGNGQACQVEVLPPDRWMAELARKLGEETAEYLASGEVEELLDIVEVALGIAAAKGLSPELFERLRLEKQKVRGGFRRRLYLVSAG